MAQSFGEILAANAAAQKQRAADMAAKKKEIAEQVEIHQVAKNKGKKVKK